MAFFDTLIGQVDGALRTLSGTTTARRETPAAHVPERTLDAAEQRHAAGLMRVNHTGEICAQALYEGQALTASNSQTREALLAAAREEGDHLAWCEDRISQLGSRTSLLNPVFYAASYALGAATGLLGDKVSLGFVEATEDQVCRHLESHLAVLPDDDEKSRRIIEQMHADESRHGQEAMAAGGVAFPRPLRGLMTAVSRLMTETTYRI